ncbi:LLM class flavin-dependent oxidoreductase [Plantibacter sp. VKM Ac-2885]|uniref:LLM class flavin-dependent oxidoreductase n=1 Tax=Plantibacter sp. VKM Ac-2885 TaxID=2783828 RepID=UPI00188B2D49|nr:LLM class flavin-dependent oxidoreductase [Plantibacter sp. VKM Ac-2885]MBF4514184.1 LLM class flavin-dependent oxidoreductase [Plantibacter sp. VKM Ac-2885]
MTGRHFELGLNSFGDVASDGDGMLSDAETVRLLIEEVQLAEDVGLDIFSVGEHYREGQVDSASAVLLAAMSGVTDRIRLGTAVTVLSTNDPVRLFHEFSTLDAASNGRAQLVLGRASATESFPLFGYEIAEYEHLFEEKLELFLQLRRGGPTTWSGSTRPALTGQTLHPRLSEGGIPTWIGVGGSPDSVVRAARHGLPLMMAIIGGKPQRFSGNVQLYERALDQFGHAPQPIGQHSLGLVAPTDDEARELWWESWQPVVKTIASERGFYAPTRERYAMELDTGALFVGSPETVARKIATVAQDLHLSRFDLKYDLLGLSKAARAQTIDLFGREVAPMVNDLLTKEAPHA